MKWFRAYKPEVARHWLLFASGILWLCVGAGLVIAACNWLASISWPLNLGVAGGAFALGFLIYAQGFTRIAYKNICRIGEKGEKVCFFAFQNARSYFLIIVMMLMGFTLRHSPLPRSVDAFVYFAIGTALSMSSSLYFQEFFQA